jgi:hypothetical protein
VPYADPEKRRQFQRQYKRKRRKAQEKINPLRGFRVYICPRFPFLWAGKGQFNCGFLITDNPEIQSQVERYSEFARHIFPLALDLSGPIRDDVEE